MGSRMIFISSYIKIYVAVCNVQCTEHKCRNRNTAFVEFDLVRDILSHGALKGGR